MTTVHAAPEYQLPDAGPPPEGYPQRPRPDQRSEVPLNADYDKRRQALLQHWLHNPAPRSNKAPYFELARLAAGGVPHEGVLHAALTYIEQRRDCADFVIHSILRMLYQFSHGFRLSPILLARARQTLLDFKYWPDEPGIDSMCTWTENHQLLFNAAALLAGQLYPKEIFSNSRQTGAELVRQARRRILRWLHLRFHSGFSEWLSNVYYDEDLAPLINLIDFCHEEDICLRAEMVADLIIYDMALNSFKGNFGSTHGRSYENTKMFAAQQGTVDTLKLLFGSGVFSGFDNMSAVCLALSRRYRPPEVFYPIANDRSTIENRQRSGIVIEGAAEWGIGFDNFEDGMILLSLEAYAHRRTLPLVMRMFDAYRWWENKFFAPFRPFRHLLTFLRRTGTLGIVARLFERDLTRNTREQVNTYTYRSADYMLSTAQDYRPGYGGDQQSIWQASLGGDAVCFTTHPAKRSGDSPNYWTGSGDLPRAAQFRNVVICLYKISRRPALYQPNLLFFTHAYLPRGEFAEVVTRGRWIFACRGEAYLGLYSSRPMVWQEEGPYAGSELIAEGRQNVWICHLGQQAQDGSFAQFIEQVSNAPLLVRGLKVDYRAPGLGRMEFAWRGPLLVDGQPIELDDYPRYDNPYHTVPFGQSRIELSHAGKALLLDYEKGERQQTPAPPSAPPLTGRR